MQTFPLYTLEQIQQQSPSARDSIPWQTEVKLRKSCVKLVIDAGYPKYLKLPRWTVARSVVMCHRFFTRCSLKTNDRFLIACASLFMACKVDSCWRSCEDVAKACWVVRCKNNPQHINKLYDPKFVEQLCEKIRTAERALLFVLNFDFKIDVAYGFLLNQYAELGVLVSSQTGGEELSSNSTERDEKAKTRHFFAQIGLNFVNDSYLTVLCLMYPSDIIAKAAMCLAAEFTMKRFQSSDLEFIPTGKTPYEHFGIDPATVAGKRLGIC
eukprot:jgi/Chrzof1/15114/Cz09g27230.t1